jgi:hypothetical protein
MASTYVNDLRLNEMATGDGSGTWGTTTNTNLELIAEAFSYGTEVITTNADTHTTTIADGATDPGRSLYLKYTGTLDSACTITIGPNTVSKVWIIENGTSGSQDIIISQGSGANITIPAGDTKVVYSDGAGAGAAFVDAFASLSVVDLKVQDDLTVTDAALVTGVLTTTATQVATGGITSGSDIISDTDSTDSLGSTGVRWLKGWFDTLTAGTLTVGSGSVTDSSGAISFGDENLTTTGIVTAAGTSVFTNLDISGDIDVDGTTNLDVVDIDGALTQDGGAVFNEAGADADFRVESDTNTHMLFVDASANAIGINQPSPAYALDVLGGTRTTIQTMGALTNMPNSNWIEIGRWYIAASIPTQSARIKITFLGAQGYGENEMGETTFIGTLDNTSDLSGYSWSNAYGSAVSKVAWKYDTDHFKFYVANAQFGAAAPVVYATAGYFEGVANDTGSTSLPAGATEAFYRWQLRLNGSTTSITSISANETNLVINEDGIDMDFRVESDAYVSCLQVNAAENAVNFHKSDISVSTSGFSIGVPSAGVTSSMPSGNTYHVYRSDGVDNGYKFYVNFGGQINSTFTSITSLSDERLKENIVDLETGLSEVMALKPRRFDWKNSDNKNVAGFIAQEVETVLPELIGDFLHDDLADAKSVKMGDMVPTLVKAIQEQQELIKTLEARITALES